MNTQCIGLCIHELYHHSDHRIRRNDSFILSGGEDFYHYVAQRKNHAAMALCRQSVWSVALDTSMALQEGDILIMLSSPQHVEQPV